MNRTLTVSVEEAGRLLGIGRSAAYEAVRRGDIPSLRIGRRVVVPRPALARMVGAPLAELEAAAAEEGR